MRWREANPAGSLGARRTVELSRIAEAAMWVNYVVNLTTKGCDSTGGAYLHLPFSTHEHLDYSRVKLAALTLRPALLWVTRYYHLRQKEDVKVNSTKESNTSLGKKK